jgi:Domain of unknown function (DUF222)/HNH endonuclease
MFVGTAIEAGQVEAFVDELAKQDLDKVPDAWLQADFELASKLSERLELESLRRLAEIEARGIHGRDGHLSAASWLSDRLGLSFTKASQKVLFARDLSKMDTTMDALREGQIPLDAARTLAWARKQDSKSFSEAEPLLVNAARRLSPQGLAKVCSVWRAKVSEQALGQGSEDEVFARRRFHASRTLSGMVRVDGDLDPLTGDALLAALGAIADVEAKGQDAKDDRRSMAQRRADAIGQVCLSYLDRSDRPKVAGERPHVGLLVDLETLKEGSSSVEGIAELEHSGPVGAAIARQVACDSSISRIVMGPSSEPLDVGRKTQVVPPAMRRALAARDRGCRFPGCDRPPGWTDAHHVIHWADGGSTALTNLVLLCRRHHRMVHRPGGFGLAMIEGRPVFRRPDRSVLEDRGPP